MPTPEVILHVRVVTGAGGGPDKTILNSPRFFDPEEYRVLCAYAHPEGDPGFDVIRRRAEAWGAPLLSVPDRGPLDFRVLKRLLDICQRERVTVWHGHEYKSNLFGLLLRPFWRMRLVTTVHGWVQHTRKTPLYYAVDRLCLPRYETVFCVSDDLHAKAIECGVPPRRCVLIENGVDVAQFVRCVDTREGKKRLGLDPDRLTVGAIGRLSDEKAFDILIRAVAGLNRAGHDLQLLIAGEGDDRARLQTIITELACGDRVSLLGFRADTVALYEALDILAISSLREGLPNTLLEAMAMEVPVVATRIAGIPRVVRDGENGLLVEAGAEAPLAEAIGRLARAPGLRESLRREARRDVETRHSFEARMLKERAVYDGLLKRHQPAVEK